MLSFHSITELLKKDFFSALSLVAYNLLFIIGYIFWGWGVDETMLLFWFEAVILTFFIWVQLVVVNKNDKGAVIAYMIVFGWQLITILLVFSAVNAEKFSLPNVDMYGMGRMAVEIFIQMFLAVPALIPSMLLLIVHFFVDFIKKMYKTPELFSAKRYTSVLFYYSLVHVYFLLVMIAFFNAVFDKIGAGYGLLLLTCVIFVKTYADFSVISFERNAASEKLEGENLPVDKRPEFIVWGKEYNPGVLFFSVAWFCLSAIFTLPMYWFGMEFVISSWTEVLVGAVILCTYGVFTLLFLMVFFNSQRRSISISHDDKLRMRGFIKSFSFEVSKVEKISMNKGKKYGGYLHILIRAQGIRKPKKFIADSFEPQEVKKILERLQKINERIMLVGMEKFD